MADKITVGGIVKTSIVTAFTIAAALIWKDLFSETVEIFFPQEALFYKFVGAVIATLFVILAIFVTLKTEQRAEIILKGWKKISKHKRKEILKELKKEEIKRELKKEV